MTVKREDLLRAAKAFCDSFATQAPPEDIFSHFSTTETVSACEHGLRVLAPFLGREYVGTDNVKEYFKTISSLLSYENMKFENFFADVEEMKVSTRGQAGFKWTSTGQAWDETFTYVLEFDQRCKVKRYEIWADTGAAYLASKGQLRDPCHF